MNAIMGLSGRQRAGRCGLSTLVAALGLLAGCGTTEPGASRPVDIRLSANSSTAPTIGGTGALQITSLRLVVTTAALGGGDQFGCADCQGNAEDTPATPKLITVPLNGGTILIATEQAGPGTYSQAEISLERPTSGTIAGTSDWPANATILVEGTYNGRAFMLPLSIEGSFRETLTPPVQVTTTSVSSSIAVTMTLPVSSWFTMNGAPLDPTDLAERATIETNARRSFQPLEAVGREQ